MEADLIIAPPSFAEDAGDSGTQTISTDDWDSQNPRQQNVDQSRTDNQGDNYRTTRKDGVNQMSQGAYRNMRGFSDLTQDLMGSRGQFRILGQKRPSKVSSSVRPVAADIELKPIDGRGIKGAEGYVLPGSGLPGSESGYISKNIFETELVVPRDIISDQMEISAEISHGVDSTLNGVTGILSIEIENMRTQTTTTSRSVVPTNLDRKTMYLLPTQRIENMQRGDSLKIRVIRDPNDSSDTSSYNSIILHNIRVNMQRANNTSTSASESLTPYE